MAILADQHIHTNHSFDSKIPMEAQVLSAIEKGLNHICFTDHNDFDYPVSEDYPEGAWELNTDSYLYELLSLRGKYKDKIQIGFGIEIGLQESCFRKNAILARSHEYDFIIGSIHLVNNIDTYDPKFYEGKTIDEAIKEYYQTMIKNIKQFNNFDVLGHIDYINRKLPGGEGAYDFSKYIDYTDEVFDILLENEKGIEINTSAVKKYGFKNPNPCIDLVKRYKEKGGEIITVGSDAHVPENIAGRFDVAEEILKACGFKYISVFKDRVATYEKI